MTTFVKTSLAALAACASATAVGQSVSANPSGVAADDPYVWLEEADSDKSLDWVRSENARTEAILTADPRYEALRQQALAILGATDKLPSVTFTPGGLINFWQDADHPKGVLRRTTLESYRSATPQWETILDMDALDAAEGTPWVYKGLDCLAPAEVKCMIHLSDGGKDVTISREFDMATRQFVEGGFALPESLGYVEWIDADTLLVTRNFTPETTTAARYPFTSRLWRRGEALDQAREIYRGEKSDLLAHAFDLRDAHGVVRVELAERYTGVLDRMHYVRKDGAWHLLDMPQRSDILGLVDGQIIFSVDKDWTSAGQTFPAGSIVAADIAAWKADPDGAPKTLLWTANERQSLRTTGVTAGSLYINLIDNVRGKVMKFDYANGRWTGMPVALPDNASISVMSASKISDQILFSVSNFLQPETLYYADGGAPLAIKSAPERFDASGASVEQHEAVSTDGTRIPYFLVKPKGMMLDGTTPTLLTGYGGFQVSRSPYYLSEEGKLWLERGGAFVVANLRGGGEFGALWHDAAVRENKQKTWDDFTAVAQDLIARKVTSPRHLGIEGESQGGLLVGVAFTQHPELYNAAISWVPLFDMLRFPYMGRGASWVGEYGDPRKPEERAWIEQYSPYQKLVQGATFPEPFLMASTADDRTNPAHARKAAARLKEIGQPYFYYEDMIGGHSAGVDPEQQAKLKALQTIYLLRRLKD